MTCAVVTVIYRMINCSLLTNSFIGPVVCISEEDMAESLASKHGMFSEKKPLGEFDDIRPGLVSIIVFNEKRGFYLATFFAKSCRSEHLISS